MVTALIITVQCVLFGVTNVQVHTVELTKAVELGLARGNIFPFYQHLQKCDYL